MHYVGVPLPSQGEVIDLASHRENGSRTDDDLICLARGGRELAFDTLVRRYQARALTVAYKYHGQSAVAQDVVQNTFLEIYRNLDRYRPRGKFRAYFHRVLLNQCRMAARSLKSRRGLAERFVNVTLEDSVAEIPDEQLIARERRKEVDEALSCLSDKLRSVVVLRYSAELSYEEISETLNVRVGTVKSRLSTALVKLRKNMGEGERV